MLVNYNLKIIPKLNSSNYIDYINNYYEPIELAFDVSLFVHPGMVQLWHFRSQVKYRPWSFDYPLSSFYCYYPGDFVPRCISRIRSCHCSGERLSFLIIIILDLNLLADVVFVPLLQLMQIFILPKVLYSPLNDLEILSLCSLLYFADQGE